MYEINKDMIQANDLLTYLALSQEHQRENKCDSICFAIDLV